jgi:hypothetical protein
MADTSGLNQSPETVWISLTPSKAALEGEGLTAKLTLDLSKAVDGLVDTLDAEGLGKIFTFVYKDSTESGITATGVKKTAVGIYTLTVKNVPNDPTGIVLVTINKPGISPATRVWSLDGKVVSETDMSASLRGFRFTQSDNAALLEDVVGGINHEAGTVVVVLPIGVSPSSLIPKITMNPGNAVVVPTALQTNWTGDIQYTIRPALSVADQTQKTYTVSVIEQTPESASIKHFGFTKEENFSASGLSASVSGVIDEDDKTISVLAPYGTDLSKKLKPNITHSGASISPRNLAEQKFNVPIKYSVTAADGRTTEYMVTVTVRAQAEAALFYDYTDPANGGWTKLAAFILAHKGGANAANNPSSIKIINAGAVDMAAINSKVKEAANVYVVLDLSDTNNHFASNEITRAGMSDNICKNAYIKGIMLPEGITNIGDSAFFECVYLEDISIPASVLTIETHAFYYCEKLKAIDLSLCTNFSELGSSAFKECTSLESISLPTNCASFRTIGAAAFSFCASLQRITIPASVAYLGGGAFGWCAILESVDLSQCAELTTIEMQTFTDGPALLGIIWPPNVSTINDYVFCNCTALTSVELPASVNAIGKWAFKGCTSLDSATFNSNGININQSEPFPGNLASAYAAHGMGTYKRAKSDDIWSDWDMK